MKFRLWVEAQGVNEPYYRIVSPMHGGGAKRSGLKETAPGTYWTPRWDAILLMIRQNFLHAMSVRDNWNIKIYKLDKAIMDDPPKEHRWAFQYATDAGEQVLVKALSKPEIIYDGPIASPEIENMVQDSFEIEKNYPVDFEKIGVPAKWKGKQVYLLPNYDRKELEVAEKSGWKFNIIHSIRSMEEMRKFENEANIDWDKDENAMLSWFFHDMGWE